MRKQTKAPRTKQKHPDYYGIEHNEITHYLKKYLQWLDVRHYSPRTVSLRKISLSRFIKWSDERSIQHPQEVTRPILERYRRYLYYYRKQDGQPLSIRTQGTRLEPIRGFFKWLTKENYLLYNPASELELPRQHRRLPQHILTPDEIELILNQTALHGDIGLRDRAIIETLYSTGLRKIEMINLKLYDIDLSNGTLMVREGKGKKDRMVPLGERACAWVQKYIEDVRPRYAMEPDEGTVFLMEYGQAMIKNRMSDTVKRHIEAAGITKPGACHIFRHSMATHMLENGADIRYIQMILGHSMLSTTEIYTQVSIRKLKEVHALTHPAKIKKESNQDKENNASEEITEDELLNALAAEVDEEQETEMQSDNV